MVGDGSMLLIFIDENKNTVRTTNTPRAWTGHDDDDDDHDGDDDDDDDGDAMKMTSLTVSSS